MVAASSSDPRLLDAVRCCVTALRKVAGYALPAAIDQQMTEMGERKESLTPAEHAQLLALVGFAQERTVEKLQAELALRRLEALFPTEVRALAL